jgi:hypothetical protein
MRRTTRFPQQLSSQCSISSGKHVDKPYYRQITKIHALPGKTAISEES